MAVDSDSEVRVHVFSSTGRAYDACQCDENVRDGDCLVIPDEGVVGLAWTWPVAVTAKKGELHSFKEGRQSLLVRKDGVGASGAQVRAALEQARQLGLALRPELEADEAILGLSASA